MGEMCAVYEVCCVRRLEFDTHSDLDYVECGTKLFSFSHLL